MTSSQFYVTGDVKQSDIRRAFGATSIGVKGSEKGPAGFHVPRGPAVLVDAVLSEIEERLGDRRHSGEVAHTLALQLNTLQKAMREQRIGAPIKKRLGDAAPCRQARVPTPFVAIWRGSAQRVRRLQ